MQTESAIWTVLSTFVSDDPDQLLVERAQAGEVAAFEQLYARYQAPISRMVANLVRNPADTPDLVQEVFTKVYMALDRIQPNLPFRPWLYRIAGNHCLDYLRKRKRQLVRLDPNPEAAEHTQPVDPSATPAEQVVAQDLVNKLFAGLKPRDRWLLIMKEVEGLTLEEISAMTGMGISALKVALFRARRRLQRRYGDMRSHQSEASV